MVEDEYLLADDLVRIFRTHGATIVGPIGRLEIALAALNRGDFDAAVMDLKLNGENSYAIADGLARLNIPFLFLTGYGAEAIPLRFRHVKCWDKPFKDGDIIKEVARLCSKCGGTGSQLP